MSDHLYHQALSANRKLLEENARLKAEVQNLRYQAVHDVGQLGEQSAEIAHLKAEVERLTKAGDAMAVVTAYELRIDEGEELPTCVQSWNAAKEGKPSV